MNVASIPYLQSEKHFRRYESYIAEVVNRWPGPVHFEPKPPVSSVETLSSRIRICIAALERSLARGERWTVEGFSLDRFAEINAFIVTSTSIKPGWVTCGHGANIKENLEVRTVDPVVEQVIPKVNLKDPPTELITAILTLHHYRLLCEPSVIELVEDKDVKFIENFGKTFDIAVERDGNKFTIL